MRRLSMAEPLRQAVMALRKDVLDLHSYNTSVHAFITTQAHEILLLKRDLAGTRQKLTEMGKMMLSLQALAATLHEAVEEHHHPPIPTAFSLPSKGVSYVVAPTGKP